MTTSNIASDASAPSKTAISSVAKAAKSTSDTALATTKVPARKVTRSPRPKPAAKKAVANKAQKMPAKTQIQTATLTSDTSEENKIKKPKLVRDGFTMPKNEYAVLDVLKLRAAKLGRPAKKSELLRAGIKALEAMSDAALTQALDNVPAIKTGRPKKD
ncbi:MAG: hypothetical protein EBR27_11415 [Betaproteobacteria bacterium]|nr:hypothetical protein [Betaproteobacteria bacterium]